MKFLATLKMIGLGFLKGLELLSEMIEGIFQIVGTLAFLILIVLIILAPWIKLFGEAS